MKLKVSTTGINALQKKYERYGKEVVERSGDAAQSFVENVRDEYKSNARVDTGDLRRRTIAEIERSGVEIRASVYNNSDHVMFKEKGHMVRKGQLFYDKKSGTFKRVKQTRFIKGDHNFETAVRAHEKDFKKDMLKAVKFHD